MKFIDRKDAGKRLSERIIRYLRYHGLSGDNKRLVAVGLPRGGVPVAFEVSSQLDCPLEIIVSKKLPYPGQPEYAIGAVSSDGVVVLNPDIPEETEWRRYVEERGKELLQQTKEIENEFYKRSSRNGPISLQDKIVIIVDDGVATGMTAIAAIETVRRRGAKRVIVAAPVMSASSYGELLDHADGVVALEIPQQFEAVGAHYDDFSQSSNEDVVDALRTVHGVV